MNGRERIEDELRNAEEYEELARQHPAYECVFRDMARDERSHARMLEYLFGKSPHSDSAE